jgi:hypothetical protein
MKNPVSGRSPMMNTDLDLELCCGVRHRTSDGYCEERELDQSKEMHMKTDVEIRRDVESELQWDPSVDDKKTPPFARGRARRNYEAGVIGYDLRQPAMRGIICQIAFLDSLVQLHLVLIHIHPRYRNAQTHSFLQIHVELR